MMAATSPVRVLLVEDHLLFREGLRRLLEAGGAVEIVAEAGSAAEALQVFAGELKFDLALIDYQLGTAEHIAGGLGVLRALRERHPGAAAIVLTGGLSREALADVTGLYGAGVFLKTETVTELQWAIARTMEGEVVISPGATKAAGSGASERDAPEPVSFTERELLVLRGITEGLANKEIALQLQTTETNVKAIVQRLFWKSGVRSRSQLVRYVFEFNVGLL